jgi:S-formylglutathione hydrolase
MTIERIALNRCFEGEQQRFSHEYWLSGLTCSDENFVQKAGAQRYAAEHGVAIVATDTSPRGDKIPDDPQGSWDFGLGAGFYVNATEDPWRVNYRMYDYITEEIPALIAANFPILPELSAIFGHSMGGHGALTIALRNPDRYRSVSAFSPIVAPSQCPWGTKALGNYLGDDIEKWKNYDSCQLIRAGAQQLPMLVDQGEADDFLAEQLRTELLESACKDTGYEATIRRQEGYDHSYFFIASFVGSHIAFHARELTRNG